MLLAVLLRRDSEKSVPLFEKCLGNDSQTIPAANQKWFGVNLTTLLTGWDRTLVYWPERRPPFVR